MAFVKIEKSGPPRHTRGQGVVEAMVALPVFLVLACLVFQIFFLAIARTQLQYAAFYAARAGAVHGGDIRVMEKTARRILAASPGFSPLTPNSLQIEIIDGETSAAASQSPKADHVAGPSPLSIRVHWDYPLTIPLASSLIANFHKAGTFSPRLTIPLQASWTMTRHSQPEKDHDQ
jgi:hypothetical protein